jgi:hypothetical protein
MPKKKNGFGQMSKKLNNVTMKGVLDVTVNTGISARKK